MFRHRRISRPLGAPCCRPAIGQAMLSRAMGMFAALAVRDFRYLWWGTALGHVGFWAYIIAQGWLAWELTNSATFVGLVTTISGLPGLLLMLPGGVMADRWDRRFMLVTSNGVQMVGGIALAALIWAGALEPWQLLALVVVIASSAAVNLPARQSLGPQLVGPSMISDAVALSAVSFNGSRVLGPAVAGVLIALVGLNGCFVFIAGCFVLATALTIPIGPDRARNTHSRQQSVLENFVDGLHYVRDEPVVRGSILVAASQNSTGMIYSQLMPVFAGAVLGVGGGGLGALMTAVGVGSTIGAFGAALFTTLPRRGLVTLATGVGYGAGVLGFALAPSIEVAIAALVALGLMQAISTVSNQTILNLATPDELRGRAMSVFMTTWNLAPLSGLPAGWLADQIGAPMTVAVSGAVLTVTMILASAGLAHVRDFRDAQYARGYRVTTPAIPR
ncbi:MAG: MFS transporter [Chloroflexi bacterium]|nr:MFS transporter [Chloroflexota bacterium]